MKKPTIIRQKIRLLFFILGITTLILSSVLSLGGVMIARNRMEVMGEQLGESARDSVTELVSEHEREQLEQLVHEKVGMMDAIFETIAQDTQMMSEVAEDIFTEPQKYLPQKLIQSKSIEDGWSLALLLTPSGVDNRENLRDKIALGANCQVGLRDTALSYDVICSNYVCFEEGYGFIVDTGEDDMKADYFDNPLDYVPLNFVERPWYKNAKEKNSITFSDTMLNASAGNSDPIIVCSAPVNVKGKFVGVSGLGFFIKDVAKASLSTSIGKTGYCFIMNKYGQVIVSPKSEGDLSVKSDFPDLRKISTGSLSMIEENVERGDLTLAEAAEKMSRGEKGLMQVKVDGEKYYLAFEPLKSVNWSFGALIRVSEVTAPIDNLAVSINNHTNNFINKAGSFSYQLFILMAVAFAVLLTAVSIFSERLTKSLAQPIQRLSEGVRELAGGNFDKKITDVKTGDELEHLATCFNAMTDELQTYMRNLTKETAAKERLNTELNVATNIQLSMLPHDFDFGRTDFEIFATMNAAKEVGGDFYDFYMLGENHLMITIADVSGKGVPAALFMATSKVILKNFAMTMKNPDELGAVMTLANRQICEGNDEMMFVTVFMGMLDLKTGRFIYVNGGHNPPVIYHNGAFEYLDIEKNCVVGMMDDLEYVQQEIQLSKGDIVYLYTDGVTEAMDEAQNQYGEDRLLKCLNGADNSCDLPKLLERVKADLGEHVGEAAQSDDITMLAVRLDK